MEHSEHPWKVVFQNSATPQSEPPAAAPETPECCADGPCDEHEQAILQFQEPETAAVEAAAGPTEAQINAADVVEALIKSAHVLRGVLADHFSEFGLTDVRYTVMRLIDQADASGRSQADLANYLQQSESSISTLIDRMRTDNLLYRLPSVTDRRKKVLKLSEHGRELLQAIEACHAARMEELLAQIKWGNQEEFRQQICSLSEQLTELNQSGNILRTLQAASPAIPPQTQIDPLRRSA